MESHKRKSWKHFRTMVLAGVAVSTLVLMAACTAEGPPDPTADTSPSPQTSSPVETTPASTPTPSAKPSPTPIPASSNGPAQNWPVPKMPAEAKQHDLEGAEAFAKYYFDLLHYSVVTNHSSELKRVTTRNCRPCAEEFIDPADANMRDGGWNYGGDFTFNIVQVKLGDIDYADIAFQLSRETLILMYSDGTEYGRAPATKEPTLGVLVLKYDGGWKVDDIVYASS